ncbi:MAG TPA: SCO family protein [Opitutus sp.]|nr:SCO family protein [Opitutus sp.]
MNTNSLNRLIAIAVGLAAGIPALLAAETTTDLEPVALLEKRPAAACCAPAVDTSKQSACCAAEVKPAPAACCGEIPSAAPLTARSLYQLESSWTKDDGLAMQLSELRGRPVVIAMFFASCTYACPLLVNDMQRLRELLPAEVRAQTQFVLVSFDTVRDTPAALKEFRKRSAIEDAGWTLVRGEADSVQELAMLLGVKFKEEASGQFAHSNLVTVLNAEGEIVHQRNGLMGDMSEAAQAVVVAAQ